MMKEMDVTSLWIGMLAQLKQALPPTIYNTWIEPSLLPYSYENNQLIPGQIIVKHNNVEVANIIGGNNYHQKWSPYFQMGIYRASWKEGALNRPIVGNPIEVYHKGVVIKDMN